MLRKLREYNRRLSEHEAKKAELENEEKLFREWKAEKAAEVNRRSLEPASKPEPASKQKTDFKNGSIYYEIFNHDKRR